MISIKRPLISVIIPAYNGEKYIAETIESALAQTYQPIEFIVVDDGSTDNTSEVVKKYIPPVNYIFQENGGSGSARNRGVDFSRGEFIAFLDADDLWEADKLELQMAAFLDEPDTDIVFGHMMQFFSPDIDKSLQDRINCDTNILPGYLPSTMMVKRESYNIVGPYETNWKVGEGVSWVLRAKDLNLKMKMIPQLVLKRRIHSNNKGISRREFYYQRLHILKASIDRQRQSGKL